MSSVDTSFGPPAVAIISFIDGIVSPTLIVMIFTLPERDRPDMGRPGDHRRLLARLRTRVTTPAGLHAYPWSSAALAGIFGKPSGRKLRAEHERQGGDRHRSWVGWTRLGQRPRDGDTAGPSRRRSIPGR